MILHPVSMPILAPLLIAAGIPDLAALPTDAAVRLHGRPVVVWVDVVTPPYTFGNVTVIGTNDAKDGSRRSAVLPAGANIDRGDRVKVAGTLRVIRHDAATVNGQRVPAWVEVRVTGAIVP